MDKEVKVNVHNVKYEISILVGHSDFDSKVSSKEANTVKSIMTERHLEFFKHIDPDIDPSNDYEDDELEEDARKPSCSGAAALSRSVLKE